MSDNLHALAMEISAELQELREEQRIARMRAMAAVSSEETASIITRLTDALKPAADAAKDYQKAMADISRKLSRIENQMADDL